MFVVYEEMENGFKRLVSSPTNKKEAIALSKFFSMLNPDKIYGILKENK